MYNQTQKENFINWYTEKETMKRACETFFNAFEKYELKWDADLCTKSAADLQPIINELVGVSASGRKQRIAITRKYIQWCVDSRIKGAILDGTNVSVQSNSEKFRKQMVASPLHLQYYLNQICDPENLCGTDNLYRCYYWLAYGGLDESELLKIKISDIDLTSMVINYNGESYPIYREAIPAFKNCMELTQFSYVNPSAEKRLYRDRVEGDTLIRSAKPITSVLSMRVELSRRAKRAINDGRTDINLSFYRAKMSGIFYRAYEQERAGIPINFGDEVVKFMDRGDKKRGAPLKDSKYRERKTEINRYYKTDYENWKKAFN